MRQPLAVFSENDGRSSAMAHHRISQTVASREAVRLAPLAPCEASVPAHDQDAAGSSSSRADRAAFPRFFIAPA
jgi:hypothetical protein